MYVDSGASETVIGHNMLPGIMLQKGLACKDGVQYEVSSGELLPNLGEKRMHIRPREGVEKPMTAQVCGANKALPSVQ